jgi:hypothetical protein
LHEWAKEWSLICPTTKQRNVFFWLVETTSFRPGTGILMNYMNQFCRHLLDTAGKTAAVKWIEIGTSIKKEINISPYASYLFDINPKL